MGLQTYYQMWFQVKLMNIKSLGVLFLKSQHVHM